MQLTCSQSTPAIISIHRDKPLSEINYAIIRNIHKPLITSSIIQNCSFFLFRTRSNLRPTANRCPLKMFTSSHNIQNRIFFFPVGDFNYSLPPKSFLAYTWVRMLARISGELFFTMPFQLVNWKFPRGRKKKVAHMWNGKRVAFSM